MLEILLLILLVVAGYLTTNFLIGRIKRWYLVAEGLPYILLGLLVGPTVANLVTEHAWSSLSPALTVGIGSIGLLAGLRINVRKMSSSLEWGHIRSSLIIALCVLLVLVIPTLWFLVFFTHTLSAEGLWSLARPALLVGATAVVSAATPILYTVERYKARGWMSRLAVYIAEFSEVLAILMFGVVFCIGHPTQEIYGHIVTPVEWFVLQLLLGVLVGGLFSLFIGSQEDARDKMLVAVLGIIVFTSGIAYYLGLSPLLATFFVGLMLTNFSEYGARLLDQLGQVEKPFYIVLYFFAGAAWAPATTPWMLLLIPGYLGLRWFGKWLGGEMASRASEESNERVRGIGSGLIAQGGLSVAMVLSYIQVQRGSQGVGTQIVSAVPEVLLREEPQMVMATGEVLADVQEAMSLQLEAINHIGTVIGENSLTSILSTMILVSVVINETLAVRSTRNLLINAGEIDPNVHLLPETIYASARDEEDESEALGDE